MTPLDAYRGHAMRGIRHHLIKRYFHCLTTKAPRVSAGQRRGIAIGPPKYRGRGGTVVGVFAPFCRPTFITRSELCGAMEAMEMESPARSSAMTTRSFDPSEIKILRCPYCGDESRATSGWVCSHMKFQCLACGEQVGPHETKIRKTFHAVRRKLGEITGG